MVRVIPNALCIGVTQRHLPASNHQFARDALDTDWYDWFASHWPRCRFIAIPNFTDPSRAVHYAQEWDIDLLILSGGEDVASSPVRDAVEHALLVHARSVGWPVIGVCRGMQFLHLADGGTLVRQPGHVGMLHTILCGSETITLNSWHHWAVADLMPQWQALAKAEDGSVEAMKHLHLPWLGLMWHPERPQGDLGAMWSWIEDNIATIRGMNDGC